MINVTKSWLPDKKKYIEYIDKIYSNGWLTNGGPLLRELEERLADYLGVKNIVLVSSGTAALEVAYKTLGLKGVAITTPFSFVATTTSLVDSKITPRFADIDEKTFNVNPNEIAKKIDEYTKGIVAVHVFGTPCEVEEIEEIANKHKLKLIYDAAHCFGVKYKNESILKRGDISTLSFHATKLFHTIEGGAICINDDSLTEKARHFINFGFGKNGKIYEPGINAKMNEFEAAMGLCMLDEMPLILEKREEIYRRYKKELQGFVSFQKPNSHSTENYSYMPVLFKDEAELKRVLEALKDKEIFPRRYFYPSLDTLPYIEPKQHCPISRDIASRIVCLPIYPDLDPKDQSRIIEIVKKALD